MRKVIFFQAVVSSHHDPSIHVGSVNILLQGNRLFLGKVDDHLGQGQ